MFNTLRNEIIIRTAIENPLDGVTPKLDVFGVKFEGATQLILAGIWALALVLVAAKFLWNIAKWGLAKDRGHSDDISEGAAGAKKSGIAFGALAGASVILGGILFLASTAGA
ncbi:hypothetical protein ACLKOZ_15760 [Arthrobacter sp. R4]|jgi:hypothetical protein|uniref:hypothetical protein n=1 Tax=Micrococcaceae TaxID=1268 RepID=UPI0035E2B40E